MARAQALMEQHGMDALLLLTHDDYLYFFEEDRYQPRAIIPRLGLPVIIAFRGEVEEIRHDLGVEEVRVFSTVGQQILDVITVMRDLRPAGGSRLTVGVQLSWFEVPVSLITLFQRSNPNVEVVDSAPVMDALRLVKESAELERMHRAAECAALGMRAALGAIREGVTENEVAAEAEYAMRKAGASGWGFAQTLPQVNQWTHGTQITASHGHFAFFGAFGMLALAAIYYIVPQVRGMERIRETRGMWGFWLMTAGMMLMIAAFAIAGIVQVYLNRLVGMDFMAVRNQYVTFWIFWVFFFSLVLFLPGVLVYLWDFFGLRAAPEKAAARAIAGASE